MKSLILHLGLQKTGSTSFQETLRYNPQVLAGAGYRYAEIIWPDGKISSNHSFPIIVAYSDGWQDHGEVIRRGWTAEGLKAHFRAELDQAFATPENLILSGEDITDIGEAGLIALDAEARARGFVIKPVILVRSPLEFITSMSQTRIRHGYGFHVFNAVKSKRILPCLKLWPDMICRPFASALDHPDGPLGELLDRCGLPGASAFEEIRQNESMSEFATRLIGHVNDEVPLFLDGAVNPLRVYLDTEPLAAIPGPKFLLTREEFATVRGAVQAENKAFASILGPEFCDRDFRFKETPEPWTPTAMSALAAAMAAMSPPIQASIRHYFALGGKVDAESAALAAKVLG